jgi:hypothetical protein
VAIKLDNSWQGQQFYLSVDKGMGFIVKVFVVSACSTIASCVLLLLSCPTANLLSLQHIFVYVLLTDEVRPFHKLIVLA